MQVAGENSRRIFLKPCSLAPLEPSLESFERVAKNLLQDHSATELPAMRSEPGDKMDFACFRSSAQHMSVRSVRPRYPLEDQAAVVPELQ